MKRRQALLALLAMFLSGRTVAKAQTPGVLTINLNQWAAIEVTHGGTTKRLSAREIFEAL